MKNIVALRALIVALLTLVGVQPTVAGVKWDAGTHQLELTGDSDENMLFAAAAIFINNDVATVVMSGPGGYATVGYAIGEFIQNEGSSVIVPEGQSCVSACALSAMASHDVVLYGELWIHAPYVTDLPIVATFYELYSVGAAGSISLSEYLFSIGYGTSMVREIYNKTSPEVFLKVTNIASIQQFRFDRRQLQ
jgi:hypothetical protein